MIFDPIPHTPKGQFVLYFYAAVYAVINHSRRLAERSGMTLETWFEQFPFLHHYFDEMIDLLPEELTWEQGLDWWETEIAQWAALTDEHLPLQALADYGFSFRTRLALMLVGLVEEDSRFGTLFAQLQSPLSERRPMLELVGQMLVDPDAPNQSDAWHVCQPLLNNGLLTVANGDAPRSEWVLCVAPLLWDCVRGEVEERPTATTHYYADCAPLETLCFPDDFRAQLYRIPVLARTGQIDAVLLRGSACSDRLGILQGVAAALGCGLLVIENPPQHNREQWLPLGAFCTMTGAIPVLRYEVLPGESAEIPPLSGYTGLIGLTLGNEGGLRGDILENALTITLPMLLAEQRRQLWAQAFEGYEAADLDAITNRFHLPAGYLRQAARIAITEAAVQERTTITLPDVRRAVRTLNRQQLDTLATRLEVQGNWQELIVNDETMGKLVELERRCRHRERLLTALNSAFRERHNRGVRALLTGTSGTGKTMAARVLAAELGIDLYRVDLAAIVNKYIGETEKNLHLLLSRAEALDVVLLLDEGDALLGSRTDVKSANDRYANLETNYLLQKLENYQGIILVTTNMSDHIDRAFQRRMDVVVHFVEPQAAERLQIWHNHLPMQHSVDLLALEEIAVRCRLTGGQIRNAVLHATLSAIDGDGVLTTDHLQHGINSEYRKAGAVSPLRGNGNGQQKQNGVAALVGMLNGRR